MSLLFRFLKRFQGTIFLCMIFFTETLVSQNARQARIEFSDGKIFLGEITCPHSFRIHHNQRLHSIAPQDVLKIEMSVEKKEMEQAWRFPEAGQTHKEKWGKPYPVLYLLGTFTLGNGKEIQGHLYTTVIYIKKSTEETQKIILYSKLRGEEGQRFEDIVYPVRIVFTENSTVAPSSHVCIRIDKSLMKRESQLCAISRNSLLRYPASPGTSGDFMLPLPSQEEIFIALYSKNEILVGWPSEEDKKTTVLVQTALAFVRDFFDDRELLGIWHSGENVYSVMILRRKGKTTLESPKQYPWRLEIWRWKYDPDEERLMLAARQYFFRGILLPKENPPRISLTTSLWNFQKHNNVWTLAPDPGK